MPAERCNVRFSTTSSEVIHEAVMNEPEREWIRALVALVVCVLAASIVLAASASEPSDIAEDWLEFASDALGAAVLLFAALIALGALQLQLSRGTD